MKLNYEAPVVTKKWHIEVPTDTYGSPFAVYRVWFGKKYYFVWKGKSLHKSAQQLAESIERYLRMGKDEPSDQLYHVCAHIKRSKVQRAHVEVLATDFIREGTTAGIDVYKVLKMEQALIKEADGDTYCLNNNEQAYIPKWMENDYADDVNRFLRNWKK